MKIQYFGDQSFVLSNKTTTVALTPNANTPTDENTIILNSQGESGMKCKREFSLPGEFEISEILIKGFQRRPGNSIYKLVFDEIVYAHFGDLDETPKAKFLDMLGENIDVAFVNLSEKLDAKKAKDLIETLSPRMAIIGGDTTQLPKFLEITGAKTAESNPATITKASLPVDNTAIIILPL